MEHAKRRVPPPGWTYLIAELEKSSARKGSFRATASSTIGVVAMESHSLAGAIARAESSIPRLRMVSGRYEIWVLERSSGQESIGSIERELETRLDRIPSITGSSDWFMDGVEGAIRTLNELLGEGLGGWPSRPNSKGYFAGLPGVVEDVLSSLGGLPGRGPIVVPGAGGGNVSEQGTWEQPGFNKYLGKTGGFYTSKDSSWSVSVIERDLFGDPKQGHTYSWVELSDGQAQRSERHWTITGPSEAAEKNDQSARPGDGTEEVPDGTDTSKEEAEDKGGGSGGMEPAPEEKKKGSGSGRTVDGEGDDSGGRMRIPPDVQYRIFVNQEEHFLPNEGGRLPIDPASGASDPGLRVPGLAMISVSADEGGYLNPGEMMFPGGRLGLTPRDRKVGDQVIYQVQVIDPVDLQHAINEATELFETSAADAHG